MTKDEALKLALEALEQWHFGCGAGSASHDDAVAAIKEALAQPEQEPVNEIQIVQGIPFFTPPKQCSWVGLTQEEVEDSYNSDYKAQTRAIEAKLEQRNRGSVGFQEALAQPEQEPVAWISHNAGLYHFKPDQSLDPLPLYLAPPPCPTCEALAQTVMLDQTSHDLFKPDYNTEAVLVEEMQRMAKRIEDLEAMLERQTARIVDLQTHIDNFDGEDR